MHWWYFHDVQYCIRIREHHTTYTPPVEQYVGKHDISIMGDTTHRYRRVYVLTVQYGIPVVHTPVPLRAQQGEGVSWHRRFQHANRQFRRISVFRLRMIGATSVVSFFQGDWALLLRMCNTCTEVWASDLNDSRDSCILLLFFSGTALLRYVVPVRRLLSECKADRQGWRLFL